MESGRYGKIIVQNCPFFQHNLMFRFFIDKLSIIYLIGYFTVLFSKISVMINSASSNLLKSGKGK